ncbi:MAG: hypothetical protein JO092_06010 [Candidatus Eremiobacteraeota bacterium]|nr:hypothetical protein [Candidatus Eremiobacteraeota bacterium]
MPSCRLTQRFYLIAAAAAVAAAVAHVCVDVAGDYLLAHDDYDDVIHHSRTLVVALVLVIAVIASLRVFREMLESRTRNPKTLLYRLRGALGHPAVFAAQASVLTVLAMVAMECFDCAISGGVRDWTALFGGSIILGGGTAAIAGAIFGSFAYRLVRWLADREPRIAALIVAAFRPPDSGEARIVSRPATESTTLRRGLLLSCRGRKRGPPLIVPG